MIIVTSYGRLGNQLFQYAFSARLARTGELILGIGFEELSQLFDLNPTPPLLIQGRTQVLFRHVILKLISLLAMAKVINSVTVLKEEKDGNQIESNEFIVQKGLIPLVTYIHPCFAQSEYFFDANFASFLRIKSSILINAKKLLDKNFRGFEPVFIHVRRGDYLQHKVLDSTGAELPLDYYLKSIEWFNSNILNPKYLFLTDDPGFVIKNFSWLDDFVVSRESLYTDFALMTLCRNGTLSNSSFSWWGSYLIREKEKIFAPKFWLGWKSKVEYHRGAVPSYSTQIDPNS